MVWVILETVRSNSEILDPDSPLESLEALKKTDAQARHPKTVIGQHRPGHQHLLKVPQIILL